MIVFDASTLVGVAIRQDSTPDRAFRHALQTDKIAVSEPMLVELLDVLYRPQLTRFIVADLRTALLRQLLGLGAHVTPSVLVTDCRDAKDNKYLELALESRADIIVSSDNDLLTLHPWRGVSVLRPAAYLDIGSPVM